MSRKKPSATRTWLARAGVAGLLFFLFKGILWLVAGALVYAAL